MLSVGKARPWSGPLGASLRHGLRGRCREPLNSYNHHSVGDRKGCTLRFEERNFESTDGGLGVGTGENAQANRSAAGRVIKRAV